MSDELNRAKQLLAELTRKFEEQFAKVMRWDGNNTVFAPTGERYQTYAAGWLWPESEYVPKAAVAKSPIDAVMIFRKCMDRTDDALKKTATLYWHVKPEVYEINPGEWVVHCRMLASEKPVANEIEPDDMVDAIRYALSNIDGVYPRQKPPAPRSSVEWETWPEGKPTVSRSDWRIPPAEQAAVICDHLGMINLTLRKILDELQKVNHPLRKAEK